VVLVDPAAKEVDPRPEGMPLEAEHRPNCA
jgi:hypothetical protein